MRSLVSHLGRLKKGWDVQAVFAYPGRSGVAKIPILGDIVASLRFALKFAKSGDVILVNGAEYAWAPLLVSKLKRLPMAVVWHGTRENETVPPPRNQFDKLAKRLYLRIGSELQGIALRANACVAVSETVADEIAIRFKSSSNELYVIPNGVELGLSTDRGLSGQTSAAEAHLQVIWVGTAPYNKGLDVAIDAVREAHKFGLDLTLTVVGVAVQQSFGSTVEQDWIKWVGPVSPEEVDRLLRSHDVLLIPTRYDACSMIVLEALAVGLPIIGSKVIAWQVGEAGEIIDDWNPNSYAEALIKLSSAELRLEKSRAARDRAQLFSWNSAALRYGEILETLLDSGYRG